MTGIKVEFDDKGIEDKLESLIIKLSNATPEMVEKMGQYVADEMKSTFEDQTENWTPLAPETIERKGHDLKLIETRKMVNSIESRHISKDTVTIGIHPDAPDDRAKIAEVHEFGRPEVGIPARPFVRPTLARVRKKLGKMGSEELEKILKS